MNPSSKRRGKRNSFGGDVDRDLLLQSFEDQRLWVVEGGDLAMRLAPNSVLFFMRTSKLEKMRGKGINTPPQNVSVAAAKGRIIRVKLGPDILAHFWNNLAKYPAIDLSDAHLAFFWSLADFRGDQNIWPRFGIIRPNIRP
jgi:hypothetical protein